MINIFEMPHINELPKQLVYFLKLLSVHAEAEHDGFTTTLITDIDYMGESPLEVSVRLDEENMYLFIERNGEVFALYNAAVNEENKWVVTGDLIASNVALDHREEWRVLDMIEELNTSIENELTIEV